MANYCFGIDVGGTTVKCGLFTVNGDLVDKWEVKTRTENNGENILPDIAASVLAKLQEKNIEKDDVAGVGIGLPGPVKGDGTIAGAVNLHWGFHDVPAEFHALTGLAVKAGNDANVAALGEMWRGGGIGYKNLIMVTLGTGVGGGIIVDGKVVAGAHGAGGEIGHVHVEDAITTPCGCGNCGCLEQVASATGIANLAKAELAVNDTPTIMKGDHISAKTVFDAYKKGDEVAAIIVDRFANYLGAALANFAAILDPDVLVIGGGVSKAGSVLIECVEKYYRKHCISFCRDTKITLAELGNDAGIYGAARMVLE